MKELSVPWTVEEINHIEIILDKLFMFQDRPLNKEKKSFLANEISLAGLPYKAVLGGLNKLMSEDLKNIKFSTIIQAAKEMFEPEQDTENYSCDHCDGRGKVIMRDSEFRDFALMCFCRNSFKGNGLVPWNGQITQSSRGRVLTLFPDTVTTKERK